MFGFESQLGFHSGETEVIGNKDYALQGYRQKPHGPSSSKDAEIWEAPVSDPLADFGEPKREEEASGTRPGDRDAGGSHCEDHQQVPPRNSASSLLVLGACPGHWRAHRNCAPPGYTVKHREELPHPQWAWSRGTAQRTSASPGDRHAHQGTDNNCMSHSNAARQAKGQPHSYPQQLALPQHKEACGMNRRHPWSRQV